MKKPTKKSTTSKTAKTAKPAKATATPKAAAKPVAKAPAPVVRKPAPRPSFTVVTAQIDVGFGNTLFIRGEGGGLNWEQGVAMTCAADDAWTIKLPVTSGPLCFKFLLNDLIWCGGDNYVVAPGAKVSLVPMF
jgi:hypothetical protein